jgi:hypothetical protein
MSGYVRKAIDEMLSLYAQWCVSGELSGHEPREENEILRLWAQNDTEWEWVHPTTSQ